MPTLTSLSPLAALDASDWIAVGAALVALGSVIYARRSTNLAEAANRIAKDANAISAEANAIARESRDTSARAVELEEAAHEERRRERQARAVLSAAIEPPQLLSEGSSANFRVTVLLSNTGDRDSGRAMVELYAPEYVESTFAWEDDRHRPDRPRPRPAPEVKLPDPRGRRIASRALDHEVANITRTAPTRLRVVLPLQIPSEPHPVTLRVVVNAEHADLLTEDLTLTVARGRSE